MEGSEKIARSWYIGLDPACVITIGTDMTVTGSDAFVAITHEPEGKNPVDKIRSILSRFNYINLKAPRFFGGMVGYFSYDIVHSLFGQVPDHRNGPPQETPDARFMLTKDCIVFDHLERKLFIFSSPFLTYDTDRPQNTGAVPHTSRNWPAGSHRSKKRQTHRTARRTPEIKILEIPKNPGNLHGHGQHGREAFTHAVEEIKEHIVAGDIFQAVLSRRMECAVASDPFPIYAALRAINPSPYMYYLDFGDEQVIGASPEMLVRVEKRRVTTVPIAGTRPRGQDKSEDKRFAQELLLDKKERAEHTMLVDLARNDVGRVCKFGSVEVTEFMGIEKFSHVQHMVSTVQGMLMDHLDCYDALKSCFPARDGLGRPENPGDADHQRDRAGCTRALRRCSRIYRF